MKFTTNGVGLNSLFTKRFNKLNLEFKTSDNNYKIKAYNSFTYGEPYDTKISIGNSNVAVIEFRSSHLDSYNYSEIEKFAIDNDIRYYILSNNNDFIVTDRRKSSERKTYNFDEFVQLLQHRNFFNIDEVKQSIADFFVKQLLSKDRKDVAKVELDRIQIFKEIQYNEVLDYFSFRDPNNINSFENEYFRQILHENESLYKVYRYTSLDAVFSILKNNSFRMNGIVGMNDTTEVNYVDNYLNKRTQDFKQATWQTIEALNKRFISSCSSKKDDLTQWRLYADDSKGVCLVFNVMHGSLNSKFILEEVNYGQKADQHDDLDKIILLKDYLQKELNVDFRFLTLNTWKHFFKPFNYSVEDEVRLLFIQEKEEVKKDWLLTGTHNILNPYVEFKLNDKDLPIRLTEIILGTKCPEKEINKRQLEQYIRELRNKKVKVNGIETDDNEYNISDLKVSISNINNYR
jgi:hypothetical protein